MAKLQTQPKIRLDNVRLSFAKIFHKAKNKDGTDGKFEASFLIPKSDTKTYNKVRKAIETAVSESGLKIKEADRCLKDGDEYEYEGYEGHWVVKTGSHHRPQLIDRNKNAVVEEDEVLYSGCYVNAVINIWIQNNEFGKKANGNLYAIQHFKDGDKLGGDAGDSIDMFDSFDGDENDF